MKSVSYSSTQLLSCAECNGEAILCVDADKVIGSVPFIEVTVLSVEEAWDSCGRCSYNYVFSYDETALVDPDTGLVSGDINGIFCKGCLLTYVDYIAATVWEDAALQTIIPPGTIWMWAGSVAPTGFLMCDGSLVSRAIQANLFAAIGTAFGLGDGFSTFGLPNLQKRFPLGKCGDLTVALGDTGGAFDHTHSTIDHTHTGPAHVHSGPAHTHTGGTHTHSVPAHYHNVGRQDCTIHIIASGQHTHSFSATYGDYFLMYDGSAMGTLDIPGPGSLVVVETGWNLLSASHVHSSSSFIGLVGNVTSAIDGDAAMTSGGASGISGSSGTADTGSSGTGATGLGGAGVTGTNNPPYQVINFIIKT